jgi:hypothetical protein
MMVRIHISVDNCTVIAPAPAQAASDRLLQHVGVAGFNEVMRVPK